MNIIKYVLLSDGSSDKMLMPILDWLLRCQCRTCAIDSQWADLGRLKFPPKKLSDRIRKTLEIYEPDLLFIHRDAENQTFELRQRQIRDALAGLTNPVAVCVIPIRMQEAWLLFDERAIRKAAENPNGRIALQLPDISRVESLPDPKVVLHSLIKGASGYGGRRLKKLNTKKLAHLVSASIDDFTSLRALSAFEKLETELSAVIEEKGWNLRRD